MAKPVVLGLGNPLYRDEGIGIHLLLRLRQSGLASQIKLVEGGTGGLSLLPVIETAAQLLIIDAVNWDKPPGTLGLFSYEQLIQLAQPRLSPHQVALADLLALACWRGKLPPDLVLLGIQPADIRPGLELSPEVKAAIPAALEQAYAVIAVWQKKTKIKAQE
ncbi:MAG: hydrogenase maturation protease [Bacillota bacterium]